MDSTTTGPAATPISIKSAQLFLEDSVTVISNSSRVVKTWDLITGICKSSFSTPVKGKQDAYLTGDTLIIVWQVKKGVFNVWDVYKGQSLRTFHNLLPKVVHIKILEDEPEVFGQGNDYVEVESMEREKRKGLVAIRIKETPDGFFIHKSRQNPGSQWPGGLWDPQDMKVSYPAGFQS